MTDERQQVSPEQFEVIKAVLGADAETFKRTKLGQYIYDRIEGEEEQLMDELMEAALKSTDQVVLNLALNINMRRQLPKFIEEAITTGRSARENIDQMEASEKDF